MAAQQSQQQTDRTDWFVHGRFGLFIHWGLYAAAARHEWVKKNESTTDADYQPYFDHFDPDLYDPVALANAAKGAGAKYSVITSKHHDGFCLWDSASTDYKAPNTPLMLQLPVQRPPVAAPVIELFLKGWPMQGTPILESMGASWC